MYVGATLRSYQEHCSCTIYCSRRSRTCFFNGDTSGDTIVTEINDIIWQREKCILQASHYCPTSLSRSLLRYVSPHRSHVPSYFVLVVDCLISELVPGIFLVLRAHKQHRWKVMCSAIDLVSSMYYTWLIDALHNHWLTYYTIIDWRITQTLIDVLHKHWLMYYTIIDWCITQSLIDVLHNHWFLVACHY